jgi:NNP family nitrate/nitrite transporter-like MFS transporter
VPILLLIAGSIFIFGQDHPSGRWEDRPDSKKDHLVTSSFDKKDLQDKKENARVDTHQGQEEDATPVDSTVDSAVKGSPQAALVTYFNILISPLIWLPPLAYMTTFGLELAIDSNMANVLFSLFNTKRPDFTQTQAGYYTSIL